jgi:hypothetical protein
MFINNKPYNIFTYKNSKLVLEYYPDLTTVNFILQNLWILCNKDVDAKITKEMIEQAYSTTPFILFLSKIRNTITNKYIGIKEEHIIRMSEKLWTMANENIDTIITDEMMHYSLIMMILETPEQLVYINQASYVMLTVIKNNDMTVFLNTILPIINQIFPTLKQNHVYILINHLWNIYDKNNRNITITDELVKKALDMTLAEI